MGNFRPREFFGEDYEEVHKNRVFYFFLFFCRFCFLLFNGNGKCSIRGDSTYKLSNHFFLVLVLKILHLLLSIKVTDRVSLNRNYIPVSLPKAQIWDRVSEKNSNMRDSGIWQGYRLCFCLINNFRLSCASWTWVSGHKSKGEVTPFLGNSREREI